MIDEDVTLESEKFDSEGNADYEENDAPESDADEQTESAEDGYDEADAEELVRRDIEELKDEFPELGDIEDITELSDPMRYAALRDLGLSAREAYLATTPRQAKPRDSRAHLSPALTKSARTPTSGISRSELLMARSLFPDLSDSEIARLYKKALDR